MYRYETNDCTTINVADATDDGYVIISCGECLNMNLFFFKENINCVEHHTVVVNNYYTLLAIPNKNPPD